MSIMHSKHYPPPIWTFTSGQNYLFPTRAQRMGGNPSFPGWVSGGLDTKQPQGHSIRHAHV